MTFIFIVSPGKSCIQEQIECIFTCLLFYSASPCLRPCLMQGPVHSLLQQDVAAEILVQTGNSVDYSLAIRLLSLRWLSLLHHEIAWLSARLESLLCLNPPPHLHPPNHRPSHPFAQPSKPLLPPQIKKRKKKFIWIPSGH